MSHWGDVYDEPVTFLATRTAVAMTAATVLIVGVFSDPLWFGLAYGFAVGAAFAVASFMLRRALT